MVVFLLTYKVWMLDVPAFYISIYQESTTRMHLGIRYFHGHIGLIPSPATHYILHPCSGWRKPKSSFKNIFFMLHRTLWYDISFESSRRDDLNKWSFNIFLLRNECFTFFNFDTYRGVVQGFLGILYHCTLIDTSLRELVRIPKFQFDCKDSWAFLEWCKYFVPFYPLFRANEYKKRLSKFVFHFPDIMHNCGHCMNVYVALLALTKRWLR